MDRVCIICKENKDIKLFNEEHVFPAAIGGVLTIKNVCENCNSYFGRFVDRPFVNNNAILYYRNLFNVSRDEGRKSNIPNPFNTVYHDSRGAPHLIQFKDGKPIAKSIERIEIVDTGEVGKYMAKITVPIENRENAIKLFNRFIKKNNISTTFEETVREEIENSGEDLQPILNIEHKTLMLGTLKIAYEIIVNFFPSYINDPHGNQLLNYLLTPETNENFIPFINKASIDLHIKYKDRFEQIRIPAHCHSILIEYIEGYGLICIVRIFNLVLPFLMSYRKYLFPEGGSEIFIVNDIKSLDFYSNISHSFDEIIFTVFLDHLDVKTRNDILQADGIIFCNKDNARPVYNRNGKIFFNDLLFLCDHLLKIEGIQLDLETKNFEFLLFENEYYMKTKDEILVPLLSIKFTRNTILLHNYN